MNEKQHDALRKAVQRHFLSRNSTSQERAMREHLPSCDPCRREYERYLLLAEMDPAMASAQERIARGLGIRRSACETARRVPWSLSTVAVASIGVFFAMGRLYPASDGFAARGGGHAAQGTQVLVYKVSAGQPSELVEGSVERSAELAFGYRNGARKPWIAIYAVDEHGHVFWYYPSWTKSDESPEAVAAVQEPGVHELGEAIRHDYDGRELRVVALFSEQRLNVRQIERVVSEHPGADVSTRVPGTIQVTQELRLGP